MIMKCNNRNFHGKEIVLGQEKISFHKLLLFGL